MVHKHVEFGWLAGLVYETKTRLCDDVWENIQSTDVRISSVTN
jgi:hypothetical protein